jgi:hypothetical protein
VLRLEGRGLPGEPGHIAASFRLSFQSFKVRVQLVLGNAFTAV